jgi:formylglycine-generating enzyme required for sulfatase activity
MPRAPERVWWEKAEMELRLVPAGDFRMGSPPGEGAADEHPQHTVYLDAYYIGRYPVTNAQYAAFVRDTGHHPPDSWDGEEAPEGEENHPVVGVSSGDAVAFCDWADLCLPTEAQWEKAARGKEGHRYPWGDHEPTKELCNFSENEGGTTPVGKYSPQGDSPYGCTDMAGNVWELCADWYREDYYQHSPPVNPTGPSVGSFRVLRGGAWFGVASYVRCCVRFWYDPVGTWSSAGFRCARGPD